MSCCKQHKIHLLSSLVSYSCYTVSGLCRVVNNIKSIYYQAWSVILVTLYQDYIRIMPCCKQHKIHLLSSLVSYSCYTVSGLCRVVNNIKSIYYQAWSVILVTLYQDYIRIMPGCNQHKIHLLSSLVSYSCYTVSGLCRVVNNIKSIYYQAWSVILVTLYQDYVVL